MQGERVDVSDTYPPTRHEVRSCREMIDLSTYTIYRLMARIVTGAGVRRRSCPSTRVANATTMRARASYMDSAITSADIGRRRRERSHRPRN